MINRTQDLIFLTDGAELRTAVTDTIQAYNDFVHNTAGPKEHVTRWVKHHHTVCNMFGFPMLRLNDIRGFLSSVAVFCTIDSNKCNTSVLDSVYRYTKSKIRLSVSQVPKLRRFGRFILYRLWATGHLVLPITFSMSKTIDREHVFELSSELGRFCINYPDNQNGGSTHIRMTQHATRWIYCTTWHTPEDISLDDAIAVNRFLLDCYHGKVGFSAPAISPCVRLMLSEVKKHFGRRAPYDDADLKKFDLFFLRDGQEAAFAEIDRLLTEKDHTQKENRRARKHKIYEKYKQKAKKRRARPVFEIAKLLADANADSLDAEVVNKIVYKRRFERKKWFPDCTELSFLTYHLPDTAIDIWSRLFDGYLSFRINSQGYEAEKPVIGALRVLADYLAICLPAFYSLTQSHLAQNSSEARDLEAANGTRKIITAIPSCPKEFTRFPYVDDRNDPQCAAPTIKRYLAERYPAASSQYSHLNHIRTFFAYIEKSYADSGSIDIAGPNFRNPISQDFDLPRLEKSSSGKTNKLPFSKHVIPHLLSYVYCIEAFGIYVQGIDTKLPLNGTLINTADYGWVPVYWHLGRAYPILSCPLTAVCAPNIVDHVQSQAPSLTVLRMILLALEVGLRMQGAQWLCRKKFDSLTAESRYADVYMLYVNTDKTNNGFPTPILRRVREMLLREKSYQESLLLADVEIFYENREHTRFDKLIPLFRNPQNGKPFSDAAYQRVWLRILMFFQKHYAEHVGYVPFVSLTKPNDPVIKYTAEEYAYTPLKVSPLYTPHSCRSTFVTRRSPFIDLADLADAVGQASHVVASHYDYPEFDELATKLAYADASVQNVDSAPAQVRSGPAFIKASDQNSSLQKAFRTDRGAAIRNFGFISLRRGLDDDSETTALELLRGSPLSHIAFRDTHICPVGEHCPEEVIKDIGEPRRCGLCPLACKSFDHLTAISAKIRQLQERINANRKRYQKLLTKKAEEGDLGEMYDLIDADTQEMLAWKLTEEILWDIRQQHPDTFKNHMHVAEPDLVRKHLQRVVKPSTEQEFLLRRIVEANEYPTMATDWLSLQANRFRRKILADLGPIPALAAENDDDVDDVEVLAAYVNSVMVAKDLSLPDLAEALNTPAVPSQRAQILLLESSAGRDPSNARP